MKMLPKTCVLQFLVLFLSCCKLTNNLTINDPTMKDVGLPYTPWNTTINILIEPDSVIGWFDIEEHSNLTLFHFSLWLLSNVDEPCNGLRGNASHQLDVEPDSNLRVLAKFRTPPINGNYCINVDPVNISRSGNCEMGCPTINSKTFPLSAPCFKNCQNWTMENTLIYYWKTKILELNFQVISEIPNDSICTVTLYESSLIHCNDMNKLTEISGVETTNRTIQYRDLEPGKYCVWVVPTYHCTDRCIGRYTSVVEISTVVTEDEEEGKSKWYVWYFVIGALAMAIILFALIAIYIKIRKRKRGLVFENSPPLEVQYNNSTTNCKDITIAYCRESEEHHRVIAAFANFLRTVLKVNVHLDFEEEEKILENPSMYYSPDPKSIIIVIESESTVCRQEAAIERKELRCKDEDYMDDLQNYHLVSILARLENLTEYQNLFVVHFSYTPPGRVLNGIAQNKRYKLPNHLFQLVHFLKTGRDTNLIDDRVMAEFQNEQTYLELLEAIREAQKYVEENKDFAKEMFQ